MWRVASLVRSHHGRVPSRLVMARWSDSDQANNSIAASRFFSRRATGDDEELLELEAAEAEKKKAKALSAPGMEFYNQLAEDFDSDDEEEEGARDNAEYRRKQAEIQLELDSRTGRAWTDPWLITQEQWMSTTTLEDLPEWSPEYISRISQERVKLHPGKHGRVGLNIMMIPSCRFEA
jgi:hypothetical protein